MEFTSFYLEQLLRIKNGKDHKSLADGDYPVFGSGGLMRYADRFLYDKASILLPRKGTLDNIQYVTEPFWTVDTIYYTEVNEELVNPYYLYRYLRAMDLSGYDSGASIPSMTTKTYNRIKIKLPSKGTQNKIAGILSRYDELIELNNKRIKLLEKAAEELYKEWFVRFRFPNYQEFEYKYARPTGWVVNNKLNYEIPKSWEFDSLSNIALFRKGKNLTTSEAMEGGIPVVSAGKEPSCYHNVANVNGASITISGSGANAGYMSYHLSDIWASDCSYYQNDNNIWYVYSALHFIQKVIDNMQVGAAQPHVYPKNINALSVLIPDDETVKVFNNKAKVLFDEIAIINKKTDNLIKQRDLLLPRLMSGKLEV